MPKQAPAVVHSGMAIFDPRPHQAKAIDAALTQLAGADRTTVVMACGTGKTLTAQRFVEDAIGTGLLAADATIVMVFPSLALIQQTFDSWVEQAKIGFRATAFCSGKAVTDDLKDLTLDRSTDLEQMRQWLAAGSNSGPSEQLSVVFTTYQSSEKFAQLTSGPDQLDDFTWDLLISDEAHNTTGSLESSWTTITDDTLVRAAKRLFMTATPKIHTKANKNADLEIASMDDETKYGHRAFTYAMPDAIKDGILSDYQVVVQAVTTDEARDWLNSQGSAFESVAEMVKDVHFTDVLTSIATLKASKEFGLARILTFHSSIARSERFSAQLPAFADLFPDDEKHAPTLKSLIIKGADSHTERQSVLDALHQTENDEWTVVSNCKVLSEGVDVPSLDAIVIADPRTSPVEVTQIVGRAIRLNPKRPDAKSIIVIPVFQDTDANPTESLQNSTFAKVWQTISALAEHDAELEADLTKYRQTGPTKESVGIEAEGPELEEPDQPFARITLNMKPGDRTAARAFIKSFRSLAIERHVGSWQARCDEFAEFLATHGRMPEARSKNPVERRIANWRNTQVTAKKRGDLSNERLAVLVAVNPDWDVTRGDIWFRKCAEFAAFYAEHRRMPTIGAEATSPAEAKIAIWLNTQRVNFTKRRLSSERIAALVAVTPDWNLGTNGVWFERCAGFAAFYAEHGRLPSQIATDPSEKKLGVWLTNQRQNHNKGKLPDDRVAALVAVTPYWNRADLVTWFRKCAEFADFYAEHRRRPSARATDVEENRLGKWLDRQRDSEKDGTLSAEQLDALVAANPDWSLGRDAVWFRKCDDFAAFYAEHGRMPSESGGQTEAGIAKWLAGRRTAANKGNLSPEQLSALVAVNPDWNIGPDGIWSQTCDEFASFYAEYGRRPSAKSKEPAERRLGTWIQTQSELLSQGKLSDERLAALVAVTPDWNIGHDGVWFGRCAEFAAFFAEHGRMPSQGSSDPAEERMARWLGLQRKADRLGKLAADRVAALSAVTPDWHLKPATRRGRIAA